MIGQIRYDENGLVICEICGKSFKKLGQHVYNSHNMTAYEYKKMFGLDTQKGLAAKSTKEKLQRAVKMNYDKVVTENLIEKGEKTRFKKGDKGRTKDMVSIQTLAILKQNRMRKNFKGELDDEIKSDK